MFLPLLGMPQGAEWLVILAIVIIVFGAAKLPDLARGTGQALRIFKAETKGLGDDDDADDPKKSKMGSERRAEQAGDGTDSRGQLPPATGSTGSTGATDGTLSAEQVDKQS